MYIIIGDNEQNEKVEMDEKKYDWNKIIWMNMRCENI